MPEEKFSVRYPLTSRSFMKGTNPESRPRKGAIPYNPIFFIPPEDTDYRWNVQCQDSEDSLYKKIDEMNNLIPGKYNRNILYINCATILQPTYKEILNVYNTLNSPTNPLTLEDCRCIMLADEIRRYTLNKYRDNSYVPIFSYTFKRYLTNEEWQYFYLAPIQSTLFNSISIEIHKAFTLFKELIVFGLDSNGFPYIEVLITNRAKSHNVKCSNFTVSKYGYGNMQSSLDILNLAINNGIVIGKNEILKIMNNTDTRLVNSIKDFEEISNPSIKNNINVSSEILQEKYNSIKFNTDSYSSKYYKYKDNTRDNKNRKMKKIMRKKYYPDT